MRSGLTRILLAGVVLIGGAVAGKAAGGASVKAPLTLDNTRWNIRVSVVKKPKLAEATGFRDVLYFQSGTVSGEAFREQGLDWIPYHSEIVKGHKTDLKWSFEHKNSVGYRFEWQGGVHSSRSHPWIMKGTLTRTTADGQVYKYRLRGTGRPYTPPAPPEFTPSGR